MRSIQTHKHSVCGENAEFLGALPKLQKVNISFMSVYLFVCVSLLPLPLHGFSWSFIYEDFSKICQDI